jgi:hypothetical protein
MRRDLQPNSALQLDVAKKNVYGRIVDNFGTPDRRRCIENRQRLPLLDDGAFIHDNPFMAELDRLGRLGCRINDDGVILTFENILKLNSDGLNVRIIYGV